MTTTTERKHVGALRPSASRCWIRLKISPAAREDAWELCHAVAAYGGVEVHDCCFAFPTLQRRRIAMELLRQQFGPRYFEPVDYMEE
jgi:hypothetical protein